LYNNTFYQSCAFFQGSYNKKSINWVSQNLLKKPTLLPLSLFHWLKPISAYATLSFPSIIFCHFCWNDHESTTFWAIIYVNLFTIHWVLAKAPLFLVEMVTCDEMEHVTYW